MPGAVSGQRDKRDTVPMSQRAVSAVGSDSDAVRPGAVSGNETKETPSPSSPGNETKETPSPQLNGDA
jgi:hypothetical protein